MISKRILTKWIKHILVKENIPDSISALNFGFFFSTTPDQYMVYCTGSKQYDKDNDDWACDEDFTPSKKYFDPGKSFSSIDWRTYLTKMGELIKNVIYKNESLVPSSIKVITCGFDDGDLFVVWSRGRDKSEIARIEAPKW